MASLRPPSSRLNELRQRWEADRSSRVFLQLAEEYRRLGMPMDAVPILEEGLTHHPWSIAGQVALGRCRLEVGELEGAAAILETVVERDPTQMVAFRALVDTYLRLGAVDKASQRLQHYSQLNPQDPEIPQLRSQLDQLAREQAVGEAPDETPEPTAATDEPSEVAGQEMTETAGGELLPEESTEGSSEELTDEFADTAAEGLGAEPLNWGDQTAAPSWIEPAASHEDEPDPAVAPEEPAAPAVSQSEGPVTPPVPLTEDSVAPDEPEAAETGLETVVFDVRSVLSQVERERRIASGLNEATDEVRAAPEERDGGDEPDLGGEPEEPTGVGELDAEQPVEIATLEDPVWPETGEDGVAEEIFALEGPEIETVVLDLTALPTRPLRSPREPEAPLEVAPETASSPVEATATLGQLYLEQGHQDEAQEIFEQVLEQRPDDSGARQGLKLVSSRRARLEALDLLAGIDPDAGLTARKIHAFERYLEILRGAARDDDVS